MDGPASQSGQAVGKDCLGAMLKTKGQTGPVIAMFSGKISGCGFLQKGVWGKFRLPDAYLGKEYFPIYNRGEIEC